MSKNEQKNEKHFSRRGNMQDELLQVQKHPSKSALKNSVLGILEHNK